MLFRTVKHEKLVRSKVIDRIKADGEIPSFEIIMHIPTILRMLINKKLPEEINELREAKTQKDILIEAADVVQVVYDYVEKKGISPSRVESMRKSRLKDRGGFDGTYLKSVKIPVGQR